MEQSYNFTGIADNNTAEYETIGERTGDNYDKLEMQPNRSQIAVNVNPNGETRNECYSNKKRKIFIKKVVCIGISFAVGAVIMYVYMSSRTQDGHWNELPICEVVSCEIPKLPAHASIKNLTGTLCQSNVSMECDDGYSMHGDPVISCNSNGNWTGLPSCERTVPQNCSDVKLCNPAYTDGEYWIYPDAIEGNKIKVYCHEMSTASPSEYITVNENENYSFDPGMDDNTGRVSTKYKKIRIIIEADIFVDRSDTTFADSTYQYAQGGGCKCIGGCLPWKGYFNISTIGTGLRFDNQVSWITRGWKPGMTGFTRNCESTRIWAYCGGHCGWCKPDGPLHLYYNANDVVDDGNAVFPECD